MTPHLAQSRVLRSRSAFLALGIAVVLAFAYHSSYSQTRCSGTIDASEAQFGFAEHLMGQGDYYRAIGEFERFLYCFPEDSLAKEAFENIARCLFLARRYDDVIAWQAGDTTGGSHVQGDLLVGQSHFRLGAYEQALSTLLRAARTSTDQVLFSQASYLAGLSAVRLEKYDLGRSLFEEVERTSPYYDRARQYAGILREEETYSRKSSLRAGLLGIVPGLGYGYSKHYQTALASMLVTGLLFWATADAFSDNDPAEGVVSSIFAAGFYLGSISGSVSSARRYNEYQYRDFQARFVE